MVLTDLILDSEGEHDKQQLEAISSPYVSLNIIKVVTYLYIIYIYIYVCVYVIYVGI